MWLYLLGYLQNVNNPATTTQTKENMRIKVSNIWSNDLCKTVGISKCCGRLAFQKHSSIFGLFYLSSSFIRSTIFAARCKYKILFFLLSYKTELRIVNNFTFCFNIAKTTPQYTILQHISDAINDFNSFQILAWIHCLQNQLHMRYGHLKNL